MYEHFKEASLPLTYRRSEIKCLTASLALQRSVRVPGLTGMGKSNLLRFLVSHPQLLTDNPSLFTSSVYFLYIDCNRLQPVNPFNLYREGCFLLQGRQAPLPVDEYLVYKTLADRLHELDRQTFVILVIDRVELLYEQTGKEFWGQLRNLRDEVRAGQMAFILGGRRPVGPLYELEKLFSDTCWVGPFAEDDWFQFLARHEVRLNLSLEAELARQLRNLTGGHPGLSKNGLEWIKRQGLENIPADEAGLIQGLLNYEPIRRYCHQLWTDLPPAEQDFLARLDNPTRKTDEEQLLQASGLILRTNQTWRFFSPLWEIYLKQNIWRYPEVQAMQIELEPLTRRVRLQWRGKNAETTITRPLVFDLLRILAAHPGKIVSKDELINTLYPEEKAPEVLEDALFQLVTSLRRSLDSLVREIYPAMTRSCIENMRRAGYRLIVDLPTEPW